MPRLRAAFLLAGFTSVVAQVVLMRELMVVFSGNEISIGVTLACWLAWTAVGSAWLGRIGAGAGSANPRRLLAALEAAVAAGFPLALAAAREAPQMFQTTRGELLGLAPLLAASTAALALFCPCAGWLFAAGARALAREKQAAGGSAATVYMLEAAGSALGGLAAALALVRWLDPFQIAALVAGLNLVLAVALLTCAIWPPLVAAAVLAPLLAAGAASCECATLHRFWRGFHVLAARNTAFSNLAILESNAGTRSLAENGLIVATVPDVAAAEEAVHLPLLLHANPAAALLIGGGVGGALGEALKHPSIQRLEYVELDPAIPALARQFFPGTVPQADPRLHIHALDGRLFLTTTPDTFDVIIVNLPEPRTAQLNRFYTAEFFAQSRDRLRPGGLVAVALPASENYLSEETVALIASIRKTLATVFPHVAILPGETAHLAGSTAPIAADAATLIARLRERHLRTQYISEYVLPDRLSEFRTGRLAAATAAEAATPVNRDFSPVATYFGLELWTGRFGAAYRRAMDAASSVPFPAVAAIALLAAAVFWAALRPSAAALCTGATGFSMIGAEVLLLLAFQALYGYVYQQLAALVAAFMAGMALGAWLDLRVQAALPLAGVQLAVAAAAPAVCALVRLGPAATIALALACGALGGLQFALASRQYRTAGVAGREGRLYAVDLAASAAGALLVSAYLIPVFGFYRTALLIALVNAVPAIRASIRLRTHPLEWG